MLISEFENDNDTTLLLFYTVLYVRLIICVCVCWEYCNTQDMSHYFLVIYLKIKNCYIHQKWLCMLKLLGLLKNGTSDKIILVY